MSQIDLVMILYFDSNVTGPLKVTATHQLFSIQGPGSNHYTE